MKRPTIRVFLTILFLITGMYHSISASAEERVRGKEQIIIAVDSIPDVPECVIKINDEIYPNFPELASKIEHKNYCASTQTEYFAKHVSMAG